MDNLEERSKRLGLILLIIALVLLSTLITFLLQERRVTELQKTNQQLSAQVATLEQTNKTLSRQSQSPTPAQTPTTQPSTTTTTYTSGKGVKITIYSPSSNATVASPLAVIGEVPGNWSSEAQFPVKLVDKNGNTVAQTTGHVLGDWMTDQPVPFSAQLTYSSKPTGAGTLVLTKDNPSGQQANQDSVSIPITF